MMENFLTWYTNRETGEDTLRRTAVSEPILSVRMGRYGFDERRGTNHIMWIDSRDRRVEIYVSPQGKSVRIWVDGKEIEK